MTNRSLQENASVIPNWKREKIWLKCSLSHSSTAFSYSKNVQHSDPAKPPDHPRSSFWHRRAVWLLETSITVTWSGFASECVSACFKWTISFTMSWKKTTPRPPPPQSLERAAPSVTIIDAYLEQGVGGEGQAAPAGLLEGLGAAETEGVAAVAAASVKVAAGKPTAG